MSWAEENGVKLHHIQPGKPTQNAYIERFDLTFRNEVLDAYMLHDLDEVRDHAWEWIINYNEKRPHDALGKIPPTIYRKKMEQISTLELSAIRGSLQFNYIEKFNYYIMKSGS